MKTSYTTLHKFATVKTLSRINELFCCLNCDYLLSAVFGPEKPASKAL